MSYKKAVATERLANDARILNTDWPDCYNKLINIIPNKEALCFYQLQDKKARTKGSEVVYHCSFPCLHKGFCY